MMQWVMENWATVAGCLYAIFTVLGHVVPGPVGEMMLALGLDAVKIHSGASKMMGSDKSE